MTNPKIIGLCLTLLTLSNALILPLSVLNKDFQVSDIVSAADALTACADRFELLTSSPRNDDPNAFLIGGVLAFDLHAGDEEPVSTVYLWNRNSEDDSVYVISITNSHGNARKFDYDYITDLTELEGKPVHALCRKLPGNEENTCASRLVDVSPEKRFDIGSAEYVTIEYEQIDDGGFGQIQEDSMIFEEYS
jgi:hypothetical protein